MFLQKKNDNGPKNDLAALAGARMVQAAEGKDGVRLDEALLKSITGAEEISVRFLHKEFFSYKPKFKIWLSSNHEPPLSQDYAVWRRLKKIPFNVTIPEADRDLRLAAKLRKERSGIFNWALRGLASYQQSGFKVPRKVDEATAEYKDSLDYFSQYLQQRCVFSSTAEIKADVFYDSYKRACETNGEWPMKERKFSKEILKQKGVTRTDKSNGKWYRGIELKTYFAKTTTDAGETLPDDFVM
jgi:putative DNA primase/helicase